MTTQELSRSWFRAVPGTRPLSFCVPRSSDGWTVKLRIDAFGAKIPERLKVIYDIGILFLSV